MSSAAPRAGRTRCLATLAACALGASAGCGTRSVPPGCASGDPPNLVLLSVDTLRADHLSSYGYPRPTTPHTDALAAAGVRFDQAIATRGETWPSLVSLMTSTLPSVNGVTGNGSVFQGHIPTLAGVLGRCGYETSAFLTNMLSATHPGFESVHRYREEDRDANAAREAAAWLTAPRERPFFLWLHLMGPHAPYTPAERHAERFRDGNPGDLDAELSTLRRIQLERRALTDAELAHLVGLYDGEVAQADAHVGDVLAALEQSGHAEHTLVILTADHGEDLYERNFYIGHSMSVYSSVLRVPLLLRGPGVAPAGAVALDVVSLLDVAPTALALLGIEAEKGFAGRALLGPGGLEPVTGVAFAEMQPRQVYSIRTRRWHYIWNPGFPGASEAAQREYPIAAEELYDLQSDPGERRNVVDREPGVAARLRARLAATHGPMQPSVPALAPETRDELRALGYLE